MKKLREYYLSIMFGFFLLGSLWLLTRPCSLRPFSKHDCYCEGYKKGYGSYPQNCSH